MTADRRKIDYTVACVSEFASKHNMDLRRAFQFLYKYNAIQFIKEHYDIEHTLSFDEAIEDMRLVCRKNGGGDRLILYHGSNRNIETIDLGMCRPHKDFGRGFYLTTIEEQARQMARRVVKIRDGEPYVNVYEVPDDFRGYTDLNILDFGDTATQEWAVFVMNNRNPGFKDYSSGKCNLDNKYDIVRGPVANDDMVMLFRQFENGFIGFETLKNAMTYKKMTDQYSFHTRRAVALLKKVDAIWTKENN